MNKITVLENQIETELNDTNLQIETILPESIFDVFDIQITVAGSTSLILHHKCMSDTKINISFHVLPNVDFELLEIRENGMLKVKYNYSLEENSHTNIVKFYDCDEVKELDIIELNGENASIRHQLKTISKKNQRLDTVVYHNAKHTSSDIVNQGVTIQDGKLQIQVTSIVYQGIKNCVINQNNRIMTMNEHKSNINPILLIEEQEVSANHAAYIGKFREEQIFYLMSRGIPRNQAIQLLVKGFLLESISEKDLIEPILERYWR